MLRPHGTRLILTNISLVIIYSFSIEINWMLWRFLLEITVSVRRDIVLSAMATDDKSIRVPSGEAYTNIIDFDVYPFPQGTLVIYMEHYG